MTHSTDGMTTMARSLLASLRGALVVLALLVITMSGSAFAQKLNPDGSPNPDASHVSEQQLLKLLPRAEGRIDIPDTKAGVLIQPMGRTWDYFHEVLLRWGAAIVIIGTLALLALAYFVMGQLKIEGGRSGLKIVRFKAIERFSHWLTAVSFVVLALTGLNITFGKLLLLPMIGPQAFSDVSQIAKYIHNFVSFAFVVGLVLIVVIFVKDNFPAAVDIEWVKKGGGFIKSKHAPAGRFNLGEKAVFWLSLGLGVAVSASGYLLLFPFSVTNIFGMQIAQVVHAVAAVLFVALILAHIYIGTLGMEGAFEAMGSGEVDLNWAKEHHDQWLAQKLKNEPHPIPGATAPAE
jgi:formate dehydrogenase subunit gamma